MRRAVSVSEHADRGLLAEVLARPLTDLRGVSARREALLAKLDVRNWIDLAYFFPRAYEDWSSLLPIQALTDGEDHVFSAHVVRVPSIQCAADVPSFEPSYATGRIHFNRLV